MIEFLIRKNLFETKVDTEELLLLKPDFKISASENDNALYIWGDPISPEDFPIGGFHSKSPESIVKTFSGHYYYLIHNKANGDFLIGSSLFSILPVYYYKTQTAVFIASSPELIKKYTTASFSFSKRFILEKLLFNFPFSNTTCYDEIKSLASNSYLKITGKKTEEIEHTSVLSWLTASPVSGKAVLSFLSDLFIEQSKKYLPTEQYYVSFTSGFDGRVLLATSLHYQKEFRTFAFGKEWAEDIKIPMQQAKKLGIHFEPFLLNSDSYLDEALNCGKAFAELSHGNGNWGRAHYLYAAKKIARNCRYIVTGNFGSELFRAFNQPGVMVAPFLFEIISAGEDFKSLNSVSSRPELKYLRLTEFKNETEQIKQQVSDYLSAFKTLDKNHLLYKYLLEEVFRKYFGAEIVVQNNYLMNRTPFLDYVFIQELFKTGYAGVYSNFFENNPMKRYKGQLLYAHILEALDSELFYLMTGKGYKPSDLLSFMGRLRIAASYIGKKLKIRSVVDDPFAVQMVYRKYKTELMSVGLNHEYFLNDSWQKDFSQHTKFDNTMINYLSLNHLISNAEASV
jgi:asparagine synthetase B (glutamine-hydrolysing)